jgi:hypothetical protein
MTRVRRRRRATPARRSSTTTTSNSTDSNNSSSAVEAVGTIHAVGGVGILARGLEHVDGDGDVVRDERDGLVEALAQLRRADT